MNVWFHFSHGKNKFVVGAAVGLAGAFLGNQQIQQVGTGIAVAGLATKGAAHLFPTANGGASSVSQLFGWKYAMNPNQKRTRWESERLIWKEDQQSTLSKPTKMQ